MTAASERQPRYRIGVDVGGTFTDFVLSEVGTGRLAYDKQASTPGDPSAAVGEGIRALIAREGIAPGDIELVVHGTTLAVNTVIQRRGARVGLVVSRGNRDVLEIARCRMPSSYDMFAGKELPLVPRDRVFEVDARMAGDGAVLEPLERRAVDTLAGGLAAAGVDAVAIMLLNSYANQSLEAALAGALEAALPGVLVTRSSAVWPEIREYERTLVAVLNAYIHPLMDAYLDGLKVRLEEAGVDAPVYITASNGGTLSLGSARARPVDTLLSGPAAGVIAATRFAGAAGQADLITFDMGGTSSDIALARRGAPEYTTRSYVGDLPLVTPVVGVNAIGAGGGSLVWVDPQGVLKVGPESAGADPGPVCYGAGGRTPTITDCYLVAGLLNPENFLGGRMRLDRDAAAAALAEVGRAIGLDGARLPERAAAAAIRVATARMATELFKILAQHGLDPAELTLMPFGGAGPVHAALLAEEAGLSRIIVPPAAGTFCALGALVADVKRDFVSSPRLSLGPAQVDGAAIFAAYQGLEDEALGWVAGEGEMLRQHRLEWGADMRYAGQGFDIAVSVPGEVRTAGDAGRLLELFHQAHESLYGFRDTESGIEVTSLRVRAIGEVPPIELPRLGAAQGPAEAHARRAVWSDGTDVEVPVYARRALGAGHRIAGPGLVEQRDSTLWLPPGWALEVDPFGNLRLERP